MTEWSFQGVRARFPLVATPTALSALGRDRVLRRGLAEVDASFAARLVRWRTDWRTAGSNWSLLDQLAGYFSPAPPRMRVVSSNGTSAIWYTREPDGTRALHIATPSNWDWDGTTKRARTFVIIYVNGTPFGTGGSWSDASRAWGDGHSIGTSLSAAEVDGIVGVTEDWSAAHVLRTHVIVAFDPSSFAPTAAPGAAGMPDGTWGKWHKLSGGVAVPARLTTARYLEVG
jgi:hypothetical protein